MKYVVLGLMAIFLISCAGAGKQATPTFSPTQTQFIAPIATETPAATASPTNTAEIISPSADLPAWMSNPDTNILASLVKDNLGNASQISFYNAATAEKYDISIPYDVNRFFWYDNQNFGLLSADLETAYRMNMQTGQISTEIIPSQATRLLHSEWDDERLQVVKESPQSVEFTFNPVWPNHNSKNKLFTAKKNENPDAIIVSDTKTGQTIWESQLTDGFHVAEIVWSPKDDNQLAFLQGKLEQLNEIFITESMKLTIVDVVTGEILSTYDDDFGMLEWSPDGENILYQDPWAPNGYSFREAPCVLILETGLKRCLPAIPRIVPANFELLTTGLYQWAPDNQSIFYTYLYGLSSDEDQRLGNLCVYRLVNDHIDCPTQNLEELHGRSIIHYEVSPDQQFVHFCYSDRSILSDAAQDSDEGIINIDGTGFFSWAGTIQDGPRTCSSVLWRPLPQIPIT